jgi:hypothetical protein
VSWFLPFLGVSRQLHQDIKQTSAKTPGDGRATIVTMTMTVTVFYDR